MNDAELLLAYARDRSEGAFRALAERYIRLVYGACWRRLGDRHLAEDATQGVFLLLSRKAGAVPPSRLAGWLLAAAGYACANIRKVQLRQQRREQVVAMENGHRSEAASSEVLAMLDEGLDRLGAADREAVVLRYLQEQSLREVGQSLGVSEDAARKRVDRGLEKLRRHFERGGVGMSAAAVAAVLAEQALATPLTGAAQEGLTEAVMRACDAGKAAAEATLGIAKGIEAMMLMARLKAAAVLVAAVMAVAGVGSAVLARMSGQGAMAAAPAVQAPRPAAPTSLPALEAPIDLSTPEKTLESLCRATRVGDRKLAFACLGVDPNRKPTPIDALMTLGLAQNHLILAAGRAFGTNGEEARELITLDVAIRTLVLGTALLGERSRVQGDSAELVINMPELVLRMTPPAMAEVLREWQGAKIPFQRQPEGWVVGDLETAMRVQLTLFGPGQPPFPVHDLATQAAFCLDCAKAMDEMTADIENRRVTSWKEASQLLNRRRQAVFDKYGNVTAIELTAVPVERAGGR